MGDTGFEPVFTGFADTENSRVDALLTSRAESRGFQRDFPGHLGLSFSFVLSFAFVVAACVFLS